MDVNSMLLGAWILIVLCLNIFLVADDDPGGLMVKCTVQIMTLITVWQIAVNL